MNIGHYSFEEYLSLIQSFHGSAAPGLILGGMMVDVASGHLPQGILYDAICETSYCLPDAVQLLTPCTIGNGWLKVINLGRFALNLYDKFEGNGVRVFIDPVKLEKWPVIKEWYFKLKPKKEQDATLLVEQIREAGIETCGIQEVRIRPQWLKKRSRGRIVVCPLCGEGYPEDTGAICRACQGEVPYLLPETPDGESDANFPALRALPVEQAVGLKALHDMTMIIPGKSKEAAFKGGQTLTIGDVCRLQQMGRQNVYVEEETPSDPLWVHENEAALAFARAMAGEGVTFTERPSEGKINLVAARDGLLVVDEHRMEMFNLVPGVMCASRQSFTLISENRKLAGTRAIPLYLSRADFQKALTVLRDGPLFRVLPLRQAKIGILVTGTEVFRGLVEDRFIPIVRSKVEKLGCEVVPALIVPDDRQAIRQGVKELLDNGADFLITTAGLSVDPDDVTRQGLMDAGATDMLYGSPILPGAMTLLAHIGQVPVMGIPACALYFKTTSFDLLLPRLLAGLPITRHDLAKLGHGAFCLECKACTFPKCPFGK